MRYALPELTVLVVDEDRNSFFVLQNLLREACGPKCAAVWTASYDAAGLELLERPFSIALVRCRIRERRGIEFVERFAPLYPACPMILLTAADDRALDLEAQEAGAAGFLVTGGLTADQLDRAIRYACQGGALRARLRFILDHARVGVIALDASGDPHTWNAEALRALDLQGMWRNSVCPVDVAAGLAAIRRAGILPPQILTKADLAFDVSVKVVRGGGQIIVFHDVSERARAEQMLRLAVSEAEAANQAKSSFLATMSHELRTPLNGLLGTVRVLEGSPLSDEQVAHVQTIRRSGESLLALVSDVLDMSKIEAGRMELGDVEFEPAPLVDDIISLLSANAFAKGLDVAAFVDPLMPRVMRGDPLRLRQVVTNLVGNAIKFTSTGGVAILVSSELSDGRRQIRVDVIDTGVGIAGRDLERLFRKYSQVAQEPDSRDGGTGLGLALCRELVELMGGRIWCDSALGRGSTFSFSVPQRHPDASVELAARNRALALNGAALLLVSTSSAAHQVMAAYMHAAGGHLVRVATESEAMARLAQGPIDALVIDSLDIGAPSADLLKAAKSNRSGAQLCSFLLGQGRPDGGSLPLGFDHAIARPIVPRTFAAISDALLSRPGALVKAKNRVPGAGETHAAMHGESCRLRVLLAEDNEPNRRVAVALLRAAGYYIEVVGDGAKAFEHAVGGGVDVVLMDVNMPIVDGIEATRRLRCDPRTKHLPIIGVSASAGSGDRKRCLDAGMTDHIPKPVDWDRLLGLLGAMEHELYGRSPAA